MKHIITTAFILTLTTCYPVHAEVVPEEYYQYLKKEDIIWKDLSGLKKRMTGNLSEKGYILYEVDDVWGGYVLCEIYVDRGDKTIGKTCMDENEPKKD
jgi:hypothetical protein